ncbi:MAG: glycosyltransferase family 39 protein [Siphonobacter sp.]
MTEQRKLFYWFSISLILQVLFVWWFPYDHIPPPDYFTYSYMTDQLSKGYLTSKGDQVFTFFPPGYSVFLYPLHKLADAFHWSRFWTIVSAGIVINSVTLLVFRAIAQAFFYDKRAEWATLLWLTYPFQLFLILRPNSEVPFLLFFLIGILLVFRYLRSPHLHLTWVAGLALGISCLIRPITLFLCVALAGYLLFYGQKWFTKGILTQGKKWQAAVLLLSGFLLVILPWELYVYEHNHEWIPVQGKSLLVIREGLLFGHKSYSGNPIRVTPRVHELMDRIAKAPASLSAVANELLHSSPETLGELLTYKSLRSWYGLWMSPLEKATKQIQFIYLALCLIGFIQMIRSTMYPAILLLPAWLILFFWGTTILIIPLLRYIIPAMPFVILYSTQTCSWLLDRFLSRGKLS